MIKVFQINIEEPLTGYTYFFVPIKKTLEVTNTKTIEDLDKYLTEHKDSFSHGIKNYESIQETNLTLFHPEDIVLCEETKLPIYKEFSFKYEQDKNTKLYFATYLHYLYYTDKKN